MPNQKSKTPPGSSFFNELMSKEEWARIRKPIISAFIIVHFTIIGCYLFNHHPYINNVNHFFFRYLSFMGLDQAWNVFSPGPRQTNPHLSAVITYRDGTTRIWAYPRMERLNFFVKIPKERYRKFFDDNAAFNLPVVWADMARYIARINYDSVDNPPVMVSLIRYWSMILPLDKGLNRPNVPQYENKCLLTYTVKAEDLAALGGQVK